MVREIDSVHSVQQVGVTDELQSTLRVCPEAFLAFSILVCEGASEVGLLRGFDQALQDGSRHLGATGVALVDAGGVDAIYRRVRAFQALGYRVGVLRDDDRQPDRADEVAFVNAGGALFKWREGRALEDELFLSLSNLAVLAAIEFAESVHGEDIIAEHVRSASKNTVHLNDLKTALLRDGISEESRRMLAGAARAKRNAWYKTLTLMESIARDVVAHDEEADEAFRTIVEDVFTWGASEGR